MTRMPYRIEGERFVLRCYSPMDAPLLKECVDSSIPELQERMPWALAEPQTLDEKVELLRGMRAKYDTDVDYIMGIFAPGEDRQLGGTGLHPRGEVNSFEIGYFVRNDSTGLGLARDTTAVLVDVGLRLAGACRIEINVEPDNDRSLAIPRRLGFIEEGLLRGRCGGWPDQPPRDVVVFSMFAEDWDSASAPDYRAFDAAGRPVTR